MSSSSFSTLINEYRYCCDKIDAERQCIPQFAAQNDMPVARWPSHDVHHRYRQFRESVEFLQMIPGESAASRLHIILDAPSHGKINNIKSAEGRIRALESRRASILDAILDHMPRDAKEAGYKIDFVVHYMIANQSVEMDYFLFIILECSILISHEYCASQDERRLDAGRI